MKRVGLWVGLGLLIVGLVATGRSSSAEAQAQKTLVIAIGADQTGMDPQTVQNNESGFVMSTIFDSLVNYRPGSSEVGPGLAESWTVSPDGKVFTFKLRRGVKFHDGTPMDARTVAEDLDRAINPNNSCFVPARKGVDTYDEFTFGSVKDNSVAKMTVLDDLTLRFTLPDPSAPFLSSLAMIWQGIMSPRRPSSTTATPANILLVPGRSSSSRPCATITSPSKLTPTTGVAGRRSTASSLGSCRRARPAC